MLEINRMAMGDPDAEQAEEDEALQPLVGVPEKDPDVLEHHGPDIVGQEAEPPIQQAQRDRAPETPGACRPQALPSLQEQRAGRYVQEQAGRQGQGLGVVRRCSGPIVELAPDDPEAATAKEILAYMRTGKFDPAKEVLLEPRRKGREPEQTPDSLLVGGPGTAEILDYNPNSLTVKVEVEHISYLDFQGTNPKTGGFRRSSRCLLSP